MSCLAPFTSIFHFTERIYQGAVNDESQPRTQQQSPHTLSIHILDDDSLLNIFCLYRPFPYGEDQDVNIRIRGRAQWVGERWWYRLAHVCQRWRNLILGSASYLGLCLVCTHGTSVGDMLAHSPPLPLVINYQYQYITTEDEEAITLALAQRGRVWRVRFYIHVLKLQKFVTAMDGEYPILEYLNLMDLNEKTVLTLPETLQTPRLRYLTISCWSISIRSPLLGMAAGLVTLDLGLFHPSSYFQPTVLLQWLSLLPQLENLRIFFAFGVSNHDVEWQLVHTPIMTYVTLPNLRTFASKAVSAYLEAVLSRITAPRLENFHVVYVRPLTFSVPQLLQFIGRIENIRFDRAKFDFYGDAVHVEVNPPGSDMVVAAFSIRFVDCWYLYWPVSSLVQNIDVLSQIFFTVEHLSLGYHVLGREHNGANRNEWRKLLRLFSNVKTLRIDHGVEKLSHCFRLKDGEHPLEVLPELQELTYSATRDANDAFTSFIEARENAGRPVTLIKGH